VINLYNFVFLIHVTIAVFFFINGQFVIVCITDSEGQTSADLCDGMSSHGRLHTGSQHETRVSRYVPSMPKGVHGKLLKHRLTISVLNLMKIV